MTRTSWPLHLHLLQSQRLVRKKRRRKIESNRKLECTMSAFGKPEVYPRRDPSPARRLELLYIRSTSVITVIFALFTMSGCVYRVRAYPVCQYNGPAPAQVLRVTETVREWLAKDPRAQVIAS